MTIAPSSWELWSAERAAAMAALHHHHSRRSGNDDRDDSGGTVARPFFLPAPFLVAHVLATAGTVVVALTVLYGLAYGALHRVAASHHHRDRGGSQSSSSLTSSSSSSSPPSLRSLLSALDGRQRRKLCYQLTNLVTNLILGLAGLYCELALLHHRHRERTAHDTTLGHENLVYFSAAQMGYQLWAIPFGMFFVREPWPMIVHHFTVVVCSSMSGLLVAGFRYWTPFFYGLVELSSVPLAVLNCFKDHPVLVARYPAAYRTVRLAFAASFLYLRVVLFVPRQYWFLRDHALLFTSRPVRPYQIYMATVWLSAFFLLLLQTYWAGLILHGLFGRGSGSRAKKPCATKQS